MAEQVEHWFNRRYGANRRDAYLIRTDTGWQVLGRLGGADGPTVTHYFDQEAEARLMLQRMRDTVPHGLGDWVRITASQRRPTGHSTASLPQRRSDRYRGTSGSSARRRQNPAAEIITPSAYANPAIRYPYIGRSAAMASRPRGEQFWVVSGHRD
jgi:hypothetical protein